MTKGPDPSEEDQHLAGEYALGVLSAAERRAFEARLLQEPHLRAAVQAWEQDLIALSDEVAPVTPPARLRTALERRLFAGDTPRRAGIWSNLVFWRFTGLAALGALVAAVFIGLVSPQEASGPAYVSQLGTEGGDMMLSAHFDPADSALRVRHVAGDVPAGRVLELWLIEEGQAPRSLGVLAGDGAAMRITLKGSQAARLDGARLAVSDEPPGGAPAGVPTGNILAIGALTRL